MWLLIVAALVVIGIVVQMWLRPVALRFTLGGLPMPTPLMYGQSATVAVSAVNAFGVPVGGDVIIEIVNPAGIAVSFDPATSVLTAGAQAGTITVKATVGDMAGEEAVEIGPGSAEKIVVTVSPIPAPAPMPGE